MDWGHNGNQEGQNTHPPPAAFVEGDANSSVTMLDVGYDHCLAGVSVL